MREGEKPRRALVAVVALAGVALLAGIAWWALDHFGSRPVIDETRRESREGTEESSEPREPIAFPDPVPATAERVEVPAARESTIAPREWRVRVEVVEIVDATSKTTAPLAGAEVRLSMWSGEAEFPLARLITGESGVVEHDGSAALARLPALGREAASLRASASARLHQTRSDVEDVPRDGGVVTLRVELRRGAEARGRVVDGMAAPVAKAWVSAVEAASGEEINRTVTSHDGRFELPIRGAATWRLHAGAHDVGGVITPPFVVEPAIDVELGDLVLTGSGAVGGRVESGRGAPLADVLVEAFDPILGPSNLGQDEPRVAEAGLRRGRALSRRDGTFSIGGLAPGSYRLATPSEPSVEQGDERLHEIGDESAVLVVTRHLLRIVVQDESGEPVAGAEVSLRYGGDARSGNADARGQVLFHGKPRQRVVVMASVPGSAPAEGEYTFGEVHDDAELVLTLRPASEGRGAIVLVVEDGAGIAVRPVAVTLRTPLGALVDSWYHKPLPESGRIEPLVAGGYVLEILAGASFAAAFPESSPWFSDTRSVEVRDGAPTAVTVRLRQGGRLRFTVRVPEGAATEGLAKARLDHLPPLAAPPPLSVAYRIHDDGRVDFGGVDFTPEVAYVSAPLLEPGVHRLRFTAPGFLPIEQSFTIRAGQMTDVELSLTEE